MPSFSMELTLWKPYLTNEVLSVLIVWSYQNLLQVGLIHLPKTQQLLFSKHPPNCGECSDFVHSITMLWAHINL